MSSMIVSDDFIETMREHGLSPPDHLIPGEMHRFPGVGKKNGNKAGWCRLFDDRNGGIFGDWSSSLEEVWQRSRDGNNYVSYPTLKKDGRALTGAQPQSVNDAPDPFADLPPKDPSARAKAIWSDARSGIANHPYVIRKGLTSAAGAKRGTVTGSVVGTDADCIVIPIKDLATGDLKAVQVISADGGKQTFGPLKGGALLLGNDLDKSLPWYVAEGWASAASMVFKHHNGNACCAVAFGSSNLETVARLIEKQFEPERLFILTEDDTR